MGTAVPRYYHEVALGECRQLDLQLRQRLVHVLLLRCLSRLVLVQEGTHHPGTPDEAEEVAEGRNVDETVNELAGESTSVGNGVLL